MSICGSWMITLFAAALAALITLLVLKVFGCECDPKASTTVGQRGENLPVHRVWNDVLSRP